METKVIRPDVTQLCVLVGKEDELYGQCNWADILFDCDNWRMNVASDCGNFYYGWSVEHGKRTFLKFMSEIDKQYLLDKISSMSEFSLEETKESFIEYYVLDDEQKKFIESLSGVRTSEMLFRELEESSLFKKFSACDVYENIRYDYPVRAKIFAKLFVDIVQPKLKELVETEEALKVNKK